jgi:hypothetical protein
VKKRDLLYFTCASWLGAALAISGITLTNWRFWLLYLSALGWVVATELCGDRK